MVTHHTTDHFCAQKKKPKTNRKCTKKLEKHIYFFLKNQLWPPWCRTHINTHMHTCTHTRAHTHTHTQTNTHTYTHARAHTCTHAYKYMNGNVWLKHIRLCPCSTGHAVILSYIIKPEFPECTHTYRETYFCKYMHGNVWLKHIRLCPCSTDHAVILSSNIIKWDSLSGCCARLTVTCW